MMYSAEKINQRKGDLVSTAGTLSDVVVAQDRPNTVGSDLGFKIKQNSTPFTETSVGITLPLVPFNNYIYVTFERKAIVNTDKSKSADSITDPTKYEMTARVYLRLNSYPYSIVSKGPQIKVYFYETTRSESIGFELNPEFVQVDLANKIELVFDFSDMVQSTFDTDRDV